MIYKKFKKSTSVNLLAKFTNKHIINTIEKHQLNEITLNKLLTIIIKEHVSNNNIELQCCQRYFRHETYC